MALGTWLGQGSKMADGSECGAIALLLLCGLPGAGKTTLCYKLRDYLCRKKESMVHVLHICYDELIPSDLKREVSDKNSLQRSVSRSSISEGISDICSWKSYRRFVIDSVEKLVSLKKHNGKKDKRLDKETSDHKLQEFWPIFLKNIAGTEKNCGCISSSAIRWDTVDHVITIDDNMFYRSMRYEYFQLARRYGLGFAEIFLECSTNFALTRNGQRSMQVSQNTIETMATKIETPEPGKFPWEHNSLKLGAASSLGTTSLELIEKLVMHAILNPVPPLVEDDLEEKEASRAICLENILHQADQTLRKHIGQVMTAAKASGKIKSELSSLGNQLNRKRKMLLEEIQHARQTDVKEMQSHRQEKRDGGIEYKLDDGLDATAEHLCSNTTIRKTMFMTLTDLQDSQQIELMIKDIFEHYNTP